MKIKTGIEAIGNNCYCPYINDGFQKLYFIEELNKKNALIVKNYIKATLKDYEKSIKQEMAEELKRRLNSNAMIGSPMIDKIIDEYLEEGK